MEDDAEGDAADDVEDRHAEDLHAEDFHAEDRGVEAEVEVGSLASRAGNGVEAEVEVDDGDVANLAVGREDAGPQRKNL